MAEPSLQIDAARKPIGKSAPATEGATVWLTGLPDAGKTTISRALEARLVQLSRPVRRIDGNELRSGLSSDLGFSAADRAENVRRAAHVAHIFAQAGLVVVVALVSPYRRDRELARRVHHSSGLPFIEVFVDTPVEECARRDAKRLYARSRSGELTGLTGVDGPYEAPAHPELVLRTLEEPLDRMVDRVLERLSEVTQLTGASRPAS